MLTVAVVGIDPHRPTTTSTRADELVGEWAAGEVAELLDGGWLGGVTAGDLEEAIDVLAGLSDDELAAALAHLSDEQLHTLVDEGFDDAFDDAFVARWRNLSDADKQRLASVLARAEADQLARLDEQLLVADVLGHLSADELEAVFAAVDSNGVGRVAAEDAESDATRHGGQAPTGNDDLDAYHDAAGEFWEYLCVTFGRDSLDGDGGEMVGVVNADEHILTGNAHWDPNDELTRYTDGAVVDSIVFHELAHGLAQELTGGLETYDHDADEPIVETVAVNEPIADMFAMNITGEGTYGADYPADILDGDPAIRIPENPSALDNPEHVSGYDEEVGGHANSTILSHAYHEITDDLRQNVAEQTLYRALDDHLDIDAGMEDFRAAMLDAAANAHGADSDERDEVEQAFADVGLDGDWDPDQPDPDDPDDGVDADSRPGPRAGEAHPPSR